MPKSHAEALWKRPVPPDCMACVAEDLGYWDNYLGKMTANLVSVHQNSAAPDTGHSLEHVARNAIMA